MIEQPLAWTIWCATRRCRSGWRRRSVLDESITGVERAEDMIALGSGRIVNVKIGRVGGHAQALAIHDLCAATACGLVRRHAWIAASAARTTWRSPRCRTSPCRRRLAVRALLGARHRAPRMDDGRRRAHPRAARPPRHGVEVDMDRVDDLTVRAETLRLDAA